MQIDLCGLSFSVTPAIARHAEDRVKLALGTTAASVDGVTVRLRDTNGAARGGVDKACRIVARPRGAGGAAAVVADAVDRDLYAAIDRAAAKLRQAVRRHLARRRTRRREYASRRLRGPAVL